jgi:hypothetical protein
MQKRQKGEDGNGGGDIFFCFSSWAATEKQEQEDHGLHHGGHRYGRPIAAPTGMSAAGIHLGQWVCHLPGPGAG